MEDSDQTPPPQPLKRVSFQNILSSRMQKPKPFELPKLKHKVQEVSILKTPQQLNAIVPKSLKRRSKSININMRI